MTNAPDSAAKALARRADVVWSGALAFFLIFFSTFAANFLRSHEFGLYEDDLIYLGSSLNQMPSWEGAKSAITSFAQGRPINNFLHYILAKVIWNTHSLVAAYAFGCFTVSVGSLIWYYVFKRATGTSVALLAAVLVSLLSLHTVTEFLEGTASFFGGAAFSGISILFLHRRKPATIALGLFFSLCTLCSYELFFPLIFASFLLQKDAFENIRSLYVRLFVDSILLLSVLVGYVAFREYMHQRTASALLSGPVLNSVFIVIKSDIASFFESFKYPLYAVANRFFVSENIVLGIIVGAAITVLVALASSPSAPSINWPNRAQAIIAALLLIILAYAFSIFVSGGIPQGLNFVGRESRISIAAVYGHSLLLASVIEICASAIRPAYGSVRLLAIYVVVTVLCIGRLGVQADYAEMWRILQEEVRQVIVLTPDAEAGTVVIIESPGYNIYSKFKYFPSMGFEPHGYSFVLASLFKASDESSSTQRGPEFPKTPVMQRVIEPTWLRGLHVRADQMLENDMFAFGWIWPNVPFRPGNLIWLKEDDNFRLSRVTEPVLFKDKLISKSPSTGPVPCSKSFWCQTAPLPGLSIMTPSLDLWFAHYQRDLKDRH